MKDSNKRVGGSKESCGPQVTKPFLFPAGV